MTAQPQRLTLAQLGRVLRAGGAQLTDKQVATLAKGCPRVAGGRVHLVEFVAWLLKGRPTDGPTTKP